MSSENDEQLVGDTEPPVVYAGDPDGLTVDTTYSITTGAGDGLPVTASHTAVLTIDDMCADDEDEFDTVING
jgi:hypothetical protein